MVSNYVGFMQFQRQITFQFHLETKQGLISSRNSTIVRPMRTSRGCSERSGRKQSVKAMRAVVQRVASASVEVYHRCSRIQLLSLSLSVARTNAQNDVAYTWFAITHPWYCRWKGAWCRRLGRACLYSSGFMRLMLTLTLNTCTYYR